MEVAGAKMDKDPPPIAGRAPGVKVDRVREAFMAKLIARSPECRFASARESLDLIETYLRDRDAAAALLGVIETERARAVGWLPDAPR